MQPKKFNQYLIQTLKDLSMRTKTMESVASDRAPALWRLSREDNEFEAMSKTTD